MRILLALLLSLAATLLFTGCSPSTGLAMKQASGGKSFEYHVGYARGVDDFRGYKGIPYGWPEAEILGVMDTPDYKLGYRDGEIYARINDDE